MNSDLSSNKLILSVDVEDWYHGPSVISPLSGKQKLRDLLASGKSIERSYKYISTCIELFEKYNVKATFFWVAEYAQRYPHLLKLTVDAGHEIACHGLEHYSKINKITKADTFSKKEFVHRTTKAKKILEDLSGKEVIGYRGPNAFISGTIIDSLEEMGFQYDSSVSVNTLYNKTSSALEGVDTTWYYPQKGTLNKGTEKRNIVEFPWAYYSILGQKIQSTGGPFLRVFGNILIKRGLKESLKRGHTVFYFHPTDICKEAFPIEDNNLLKLTWWFRGDMVKKRIENILETYQGRTVSFEEALKLIKIHPVFEKESAAKV